MRIVYYLTYVFAFLYLVGETARRGIGYLAINATTMIEDYLCGVLMLVAAYIWYKGYKLAPRIMVAAWAYSAGGMFVPFAAHLEAWLREETFRPDHPHTDIESVILKGVMWAVSVACMIVTLTSLNARQSTD